MPKIILLEVPALWKSNRRVNPLSYISDSNQDDIHVDGTRGRVLGSVLVTPAVVDERGGYFYSVEWSMNPGFAVFIHGAKVKKPAPSTMLLH